MSDRNETTKSKQFAEKAAVDIVGKRNEVLNPLDPIEWIQERKVNWLTKDKTSVAIRFLFSINNGLNHEFHTLTAVTIFLMNVDGKWKLQSADLESEYQPGKTNRESWVFLPDGTPHKAG